MGIAKLDQAGTLGVQRYRALDADAAKLVGLALGWTHLANRSGGGGCARP
jgi:hypothetical protein